MLFAMKVKDRYIPSSIPLNKNTVYKKCYGSNSDSVSIRLKPMKLLTRFLYYTTLFVNENKVELSIKPKKFPYIFKKYDYDNETICKTPKLQDGEWEFLQEMRKDLNNRYSIIFKDEKTGWIYDVKPNKIKIPKSMYTSKEWDELFIKRYANLNQNEL